MNKSLRSLYVLTEIAVCAATSEVLSFFSLKLWSAGGSISLMMTPIALIALRRGLSVGLLTGFVFGMIHMIGGYIFSPVQAMLDYPLAYMFVGLAGVAYHKLNGHHPILWIWLGVFFGGIMRLIMHFTSAWFFFTNGVHTMAVVGSLVVYNASYVLPSTFIAALVLTIFYKTTPKLFTIKK